MRALFSAQQLRRWWSVVIPYRDFSEDVFKWSC